MSFGDWELFRVAVLTLREREYQQPRMAPSPNPQQSSVGQTHSNHQQAGTYHFLDVADYDGRLSRSSSLRSAVATGVCFISSDFRNFFLFFYKIMC